LGALPILGDSNPSWWGLAPVDATAIVGIQWQDLRGSPFAEAIRGELESEIGLPPLPCLAEARQILIASPALLAMITGNFSAATVRAQAAKLGMKPARYQGVSLWISLGKSDLSVALLSDQLMLAGSRPSLNAAIDRSLAERRHYSPLLSRAARYSQTDLWVVANRLPDPLASIFIPIDGQTGGFEGYITMNGGLTLEASLDAESEANAEKVADGVRQSVGSLPAIAQGLKVRVDTRNVFLSLEVDEAEFAAGLRGSPVRPPLAPSEPKTVAAIPVTPAPLVPPAPPQPAGPQVIKIFGLDDGPREIILPPVKPDKP
jgi:hypothetical protein